jgi:hypothetical protein
MPMHDWTGVEPTIYHHFHQRWSVAIADALNAGLLPPGWSALIEQHAGGLVPDVLTVERRRERSNTIEYRGVATLPQTRMRVEARSSNVLLQRTNRVAIRHRIGEVVCIIEIVSPGNKSSRSAIRQFVEKNRSYLRAKVNVLLIDPFPPTVRDPHSMHKLLWDEIEEVPFAMPPGEPLLLASYCVRDMSMGLSPVAYIEPFAVGSVLSDMPAWLDPDNFVLVPLERTYQTAWEASPSDYRYLIEHGRLPEE